MKVLVSLLIIFKASRIKIYSVWGIMTKWQSLTNFFVNEIMV